MGKIQISAEKYYLPWVINPLENSFRLSLKENYSLGEFCAFVDDCNKHENTMLIWIYDEINNHNGDSQHGYINKFGKIA